MEKTYHGSCHCGAVRIECEIDLTKETSRCNCSICTKGRYWKSVIKPNAFRILAGEQALTKYEFGEKIQHCFCSRCGIKPFGRVQWKGNEFYAINLDCLDDASP